jgi:predicted ArsR family transcriptional regulator
MRENSFFNTTRGRIAESLLRRPAQTATELSVRLGLTPNAIRQHLARLGRDELVTESAQRRGRTKPSLIYSLTREGEQLFPQRYGTLLNLLLRQLKNDEGPDRVNELFRKIGRRTARKYADRFEGKDAAGRLSALTELLREKGVVADFEPVADGFVFREHNCPFRSSVADHNELCTMVHTLMEEVLPGKTEQRTSIARGDQRCEFSVDVKSTTPV